MPDQLGKEDCPLLPSHFSPPNHACCTPTSKTVGCCGREVAGKVLCSEGRRHTEAGDPHSCDVASVVWSVGVGMLGRHSR